MNLRIGLSALQASQFAIQNISHNLANAGTEGYHRQDVLLRATTSSVHSGRYIGSGVEVGEVRRLRNLIVESAYTNSIADLSRVQSGLLLESRIEALIAPGDGSIQNAFTGLFDEFSRLSANPGERSLKSSVLNQASNLASRVQQVSETFVAIQHDIQHQIGIEVEALNQDIAALVDVQNRIASSSDQSLNNDLYDQRDQLINQIAERTDIQRFEHVQQEFGLTFGGNAVSVGASPIRLESHIDENGLAEVRVAGSTNPIAFAGGRLAGLIEANNNLTANFAGKIDSFASELISHFDQIHAVGLGTNGPFSNLQSIRQVSDVDLPLSESSALPMEAGELFVTVTSPQGERRTTSIAFDPETDSLRDVATKISSIDNVQGVVDQETGRIAILATPGHQFDFTGRLETTPELANFTGTSAPRITGDYTGNTNSNLTITALGTGEIGKDADLKFQVTNSLGEVLKEISVGEDYEAGSPIDIGDGVSIQFDVGNINAGDTFDVVRVAEPDSGGFLSSVGLNSFFSGSSAQDIGINQAILDNPDLMATSQSGNIADTSNLADLISLRDQRVLDDGRLTFGSFMNEANSEIGFRVQSSQNVEASLLELNFQYKSERDSVSGVDVNEELFQLSKFQKNYEAAIQVVRTMEAMMDELFLMIR